MATSDIQDTTPAAAPEAPAAAKPTAKPKPKPKPKIKATQPKANGKSPRSVGATSKTVADRRLAAVTALRRAKATSPSTAVTADEIATKCGMTRFDVYGQFYHTHHLQAGGFVRQCDLEGKRLGYYLTAKGLKATDEAITGEKA